MSPRKTLPDSRVALFEALVVEQRFVRRPDGTEKTAGELVHGHGKNHGVTDATLQREFQRFLTERRARQR
jgi:hypothetical protein